MREHFDASGNGKNTTPTPFGCFLDHLGTFDYRLFNVSPREIPSITRAFSSGRIDYHFRWEGASYNLDAACVSSSTAIFLACSALIARDCDTAVAGGGSILAAPRDFVGLSNGDFLSATGNCKPFMIVLMAIVVPRVLASLFLNVLKMRWQKTIVSVTPKAASFAKFHDMALHKSLDTPRRHILLRKDLANPRFLSI